MGSVLVKEMQTPTPSHKKNRLHFFCSDCCAMFWSECEINFSNFLLVINDFVYNFQVYLTLNTWKYTLNRKSPFCGSLRSLLILNSVALVCLGFFLSYQFNTFLRCFWNKNNWEYFLRFFPSNMKKNIELIKLIVIAHSSILILFYCHFAVWW